MMNKAGSNVSICKNRSDTNDYAEKKGTFTLQDYGCNYLCYRCNRKRVVLLVIIVNP